MYWVILQRCHVITEIQTQEALAHAEEQNAELAAVREALVDKETIIAQLKEQVKSLLHEVASLNEAYTRLQVFLLLTSRYGEFLCVSWTCICTWYDMFKDSRWLLMLRCRATAGRLQSGGVDGTWQTEGNRIFVWRIIGTSSCCCFAWTSGLCMLTEFVCMLWKFL